MEPGAEAHYSLSIKYETPMSIVTHPHLPPPPPLDGMLVHRKVTPSQSSGMSPVPFYIWTVSSLFCSKMITRIIARTLTDFLAKQISIQTVYILHHRAKTESDIEAQTLLSKKQRDNNAQNRTYRSEDRTTRPGTTPSCPSVPGPGCSNVRQRYTLDKSLSSGEV